MNENKENFEENSTKEIGLIVEPLHKILKPNKDFNTELKAILRYPDSKFDSNILTKSFSIILDNNNLFKEETNMITKNQTIRKIIGFITSGGISYNKCKGVGKGYITMESLKRLMKLKQDLNQNNLMLFLREKNSRIYKLCNFKVLNLNN